MKFFQTNTVLSLIRFTTFLIPFITCIAQASPANIPNEFIGRWENKTADCHLEGDAMDFSDHLYIESSGFVGFEFGCEALSTLKTSNGKYTGKMYCSGAGEDPDIETISFELKPKNRLKITQRVAKHVYVSEYAKCSN